MFAKRSLLVVYEKQNTEEVCDGSLFKDNSPTIFYLSAWDCANALSQIFFHSIKVLNVNIGITNDILEWTNVCVCGFHQQALTVYILLLGCTDFEAPTIPVLCVIRRAAGLEEAGNAWSEGAL